MVSILHKQIYNHNINFHKNYSSGSCLCSLGETLSSWSSLSNTNSVINSQYFFKMKCFLDIDIWHFLFDIPWLSEPFCERFLFFSLWKLMKVLVKFSFSVFYLLWSQQQISICFYWTRQHCSNIIKLFLDCV